LVSSDITKLVNAETLRNMQIDICREYAMFLMDIHAKIHKNTQIFH
jgi:hypothetical protein